MENVLLWITENWETVLVLLYGLLNILNGIMTLAGKGDAGWLQTVRVVLDKVSVLTAKDAKGTVKAPLLSSKK